MKKLIKYSFVLIFCCFAFFNACCQSKKLTSAKQTVFPASDPNNTGGWILNKAISDEFEGNHLDTTKWFVEGQNGDYYIWKGRAPSQFVPHNVIVENGKLKLRTQWEPDYPFIQENYSDGNMGTSKYGEYQGKPMPITTAGVISRKRFLNGYMEVKSKAGNAAITGAFWAIGYEQELDIFEQMGNPKKPGKINAKSSLATAHDWSPPAQRPTSVFEHVEELPYRVADEFHTYGAEWGIDYLTLYIDGKKVHHFTQDEVGLDWVLNNPMEVWLDSEIFYWLGLPHKEELPVDFEIEYMRVWQKPDNNLFGRAFFGFEGPILFENNPRPLMMVPESSVPNDYQKFWMIDTASARYFFINEGQYKTGVNSLEFSGFGKNEKLNVDKVTALSPQGAVNIPAGDYNLSLSIWLDQGRAVRQLYVSFENPKMEIPIELTGLERRKWITIEKKINKPESSGPNDQFRIEIRKSDVPKEKAAKLFIDDIGIRKVVKK